jgi:membrane-associated protease RseP (regulator of RpoE activity)
MIYLGVLLLSLLVVIHEAGHLLAARLVGIPALTQDGRRCRFG